MLLLLPFPYPFHPLHLLYFSLFYSIYGFKTYYYKVSTVFIDYFPPLPP